MNKVLSKSPLMKRRFQAYCLGVGRSGASSLAGIFSTCYRSADEPNAKELIAVVSSLEKGLIDELDFRRYVVHLDNKLQLEFNASFLNAWQLDVLVDEFPDSKFIFTIRDCYSWLNSIMNKTFLQKDSIPIENQRFFNMVLGEGMYQNIKKELVLGGNGACIVDGLLSLWAKMNNKILTTVPTHRILVVRTNEISDNIDQIAGFLDIPPKTLDLTKAYIKINEGNMDILSKIGKDHLSSQVDLHCKDLMDRFFPGWS